MLTRRDWWIGIGLVVGAILAHALVPRYEYRDRGAVLLQIDRWTGDVALRPLRTLPRE